MWVKPYSIVVIAIQNMMKENLIYIKVDSSKSFITLCSDCKLYVSALSNPMILWVTPKFVQYYG